MWRHHVGKELHYFFCSSDLFYLSFLSHALLTCPRNKNKVDWLIDEKYLIKVLLNNNSNRLFSVLPDTGAQVSVISDKYLRELPACWIPSHWITRWRSSHPEGFCKKGVLKNFTKFKGKHKCHSVFFNKVAGLQLY